MKLNEILSDSFNAAEWEAKGLARKSGGQCCRSGCVL